MTPTMHFLDEIPQHALGGFKVGNHTVLERPNCDDISWCATDHFFSFTANSQDPASIVINGHHGWFVEHDSSAPNVDERVSGSQINRHVSAHERGVPGRTHAVPPIGREMLRLMVHSGRTRDPHHGSPAASITGSWLTFERASFQFSSEESPKMRLALN